MQEGWELLMSKETVNVHSQSYASLYFIERTSLTYLQSSNLMRDPELSLGLGKLGIEWTWKMQSHDFIIGLFSNPCMKEVNIFLDKFATDRIREPEILKSFKSLGNRK